MRSAFLIAFLAVASTARADEASIGWLVEQGARAAAVVDSREFEAVAVSWTAAIPVSARVRASRDGLLWSDWTALAIDGDSSDSSEGRFVSAIAHFGFAARHMEYSFSGPVQRIRLTMFAPPVPARIVSNSIALGSASIRSRTEWSCPDGEDSRWTPAYTTVTHVVVHHTAGANSVPDWDTEMRNIWFLHTITNGWGDIGYNFLIAPDGTIYEGRAGGQGAIGAHFSCRNSNTAGIALLGTYSTVSPTAAALASLRRLLGEVITKNNIDPTAIAHHPSSGLDLPTILGHRDGNVPGATCTITECPGDVVYSMLPAMRSDLAVCRPSIDVQPSSTFVRPGESATLSVKARGAEPFSYQWYAGATPIEGATDAILSVSPATATMYTVHIANPCGSTISSSASVSLSIGGRRRAAAPH
jgi:N-acetylmuramoyl-L-alanine amidase